MTTEIKQNISAIIEKSIFFQRLASDKDGLRIFIIIIIIIIMLKMLKKAVYLISQLWSLGVNIDFWLLFGC